MKLKVILLGAMAGLSLGFPRLSVAQEEEGEEPAFREGFYMSEIEQDARKSQAVRVGGVVFVSATTGAGLNVEEQMATIYIRIQSSLAHYGMSMENVAQERIYALDLAKVQAADGLRERYYRVDPAPASTLVQVSKLPGEGSLLAIEVIAVADPE